ncbi:basic proline-rich protein-like [Passer montanus]|uniref:basic proline-rich protein-like n=1 Tax=Passer montanus TaxID=9160 RepID=UPI00195FE402|nr:basic proline-rich protein-like [Passer montanus]
MSAHTRLSARRPPLRPPAPRLPRPGRARRGSRGAGGHTAQGCDAKGRADPSGMPSFLLASSLPLRASAFSFPLLPSPSSRFHLPSSLFPLPLLAPLPTSPHLPGPPCLPPSPARNQPSASSPQPQPPPPPFPPRRQPRSHTDRQTDRQRQADRQTGRQADRRRADARILALGGSTAIPDFFNVAWNPNTLARIPIDLLFFL